MMASFESEVESGIRGGDAAKSPVARIESDKPRSQDLLKLVDFS